MDVSKEEYGEELVEDVKSLLGVLLLYIPVPIWWALFDQTGSRWTFQATRMDGSIGETTIKPDQMQVSVSVLIPNIAIILSLLSGHQPDPHSRPAADIRQDNLPLGCQVQFYEETTTEDGEY